MADRNRDADAKELLAAADRINANLSRAEGVTKRAEKAAERAEGVVARAEGLARRVGTKPAEYIAPQGGVRRNLGGQPIFEPEGTRPQTYARFVSERPQRTFASEERAERRRLKAERDYQQLLGQREQLQARVARATERFAAGEAGPTYSRRLTRELEGLQEKLDRLDRLRTRRQVVPPAVADTSAGSAFGQTGRPGQRGGDPASRPPRQSNALITRQEAEQLRGINRLRLEGVDLTEQQIAAELRAMGAMRGTEEAASLYNQRLRRRRDQVGTLRERTPIVDFEWNAARGTRQSAAEAGAYGLDDQKQRLLWQAENMERVAAQAARAANRTGHERAARDVLMKEYGGEWRGPEPKALGGRRAPESAAEFQRLNELRQQGIKLTSEQAAAQLRHLEILRAEVALYERAVTLDALRSKAGRLGQLGPTTPEGRYRSLLGPDSPTHEAADARVREQRLRDQLEYLRTIRNQPPPSVPRLEQQGRRPGQLALPAAGQTVGGQLYGAATPSANFGSAAQGHPTAVPNPQRVRAYYSELQRAALIQQDASQQMRRHGALTTEFLTALARGETTLAEFRYQIGSTIGKFAGWTAAATAVYGVVGALRTLGTGAIDGLSAVQDLSRFVTTGFDRDEATTRIGDLSRKYNVSPGTTGEASIGVAKVYKDQDTSLKATEVVLKAVQVAELDAADATKYFAAIGRGASLDIGQLAQVLDEVNSAQNNIGVSSSDMIAGLARATPAFIQAGGSVQTLTELMATLQAITGESGTTIGTALARTVSRVRRPSNQAVLKEFGIDPKQGIDQIFEQAIAKSPNLTGQQRVRLGGQGLSSPEYGRFFTGLLGDSGRAAFAKAQKFTDPDVARGSADRELAIRLGSVREQLKRLGVELQVIGLQLAQSGIGDLLAVGIAALTKTLQAINEVLKLFNELPTGVKKTAVYLAELAGVLALLRRTGVGQALSERYGLSNLGRSPEDLARRKAITTTRSVAESLVSQRESYANEAVLNQTRAATENDRAEALIRAGAPKSEVDEARASAAGYVKAGEAAREREVVLGESVKRNEEILKGLQKRRLTAAQAGIAYLPGGPPGSGQRPVKYLPDAAPEPARSVRPRTGPTPLIAPLAPVVSTREPGRVGGAATGAFNALNKVAGAMPALSVAILGGGALFLAGSKILGAIKADKAKREALTTPGSSLDEERRRQALAREVIRERPAPAPKGVRVEDYKDEATETRRQDRARQRRIGAQRIEGLAPWDLYLEEVGEQAKLDANESKSAAELKKKIQLRKTEARRSIQAQSGLAKDREEVQRVLARLDEIYRRSLVAAEGRGALATFRDSSADEITTGVGLLQARIEAKPNASQAAPIRGLSAAYLSAAERFRNSEDPKELAVVESSRKALVDAVTQVDRKLQLSLKVATTSAQRQSAYRTARSELSNRRRLFEHAADQTRRRFFAVGKDLAATQKELDALPAAGGLAQGDELLYSSPITGGADSLRRQLKARIDRLKKKRADLIARGIADGKALDDANAELDAFDQDYKIAQFDERTSDRQRTADLKKSTSTNEKANAQEDIKAAQGNYNDAKRTFGPKSDRAIDALIALNNLVTQVNEDVSKEAADFAAKVQARGDLRTSTINPNTAAGGVARIGSQLQTAKEVLATLQEHGAKQEEINQQIAQVNDLQFSMQEAAKQLAERLSQAKFRQQVAGILDPVRRAKAQLRYDRSQLKGKTGVEREEQKATVREDEVALRQSIIDEDLSDARFKHDVGKLTDKAYINELKKILRTKKLGKQARQSILTEIYNLQHEEEGGELSLTPGGAHLPTLTEIRKFIGGGDIGKATNKGGSPTVVDSRQQKTNYTFHVQIHTPHGWEQFSDLLEQAGVRSIKTAARSRRPG